MSSPPQSQSPPSRDPALDGLRGVAILLVFVFHYGGGLRAHNPLARAFGYVTQACWIGVELFFGLSGFLITNLLIEEIKLPQGLRNFYARRALRILPLYYGAIAVCMLAALIAGASGPQLKPLLLYAGFLQNLPPLAHAALHTPPPLPVFHLWSLAVEEQFYLLWPFMLLLARTPRRALHLSLWTFAATCAFRVLLFAPQIVPLAIAQTFADFLLTRAGALALGATLALYRYRIPGNPTPLPSPKQKQAAVAAAWLGLAAFLLAALHSHTFLMNNPTAFRFALPAVDLLCAALVALSLDSTVVRNVLKLPALGFLGRISYGFYVLHILLEPLFDRVGTALTHTTSGFAYQAVRLLAAFPLTVIAAWLSFTCVESPFLRLKAHFPHPLQVNADPSRHLRASARSA